MFSLDKSIQDQRVLTFTTFKIFQDRDILRTLKIDQKMLISFLMTLEDHYLKVNRNAGWVGWYTSHKQVVKKS